MLANVSLSNLHDTQATQNILLLFSFKFNCMLANPNTGKYHTVQVPSISWWGTSGYTSTLCQPMWTFFHCYYSICILGTRELQWQGGTNSLSSSGMNMTCHGKLHPFVLHNLKRRRQLFVVRFLVRTLKRPISCLNLACSASYTICFLCYVIYPLLYCNTSMRFVLLLLVFSLGSSGLTCAHLLALLVCELQLASH